MFKIQSNFREYFSVLNGWSRLQRGGISTNLSLGRHYIHHSTHTHTHVMAI